MTYAPNHALKPSSNTGWGEVQKPPAYYAAFVLDPDGNNIEVVFRGG